MDSAVDRRLQPFVDALTSAVASATVPPVFDGRSLGKVPDFSGKDSDWAMWSFVAEAHFAGYDMGDDYMEVATTAPSIPLLADMTDRVKGLAKKVYLTLVTAMKGKALNLLRSVEKYNGFAAWRALKSHYEPDVPGRHAGMLTGLLSPDWMGLNEQDFLEALGNWDTAVARWETQSR
jgi:hypothetical protein